MPDLTRLDPLFKDGPISHLVSLALCIVMVIAAIGTLRTGRWWWRALLIVAALIWPLPDNPLQGPILTHVTYSHGLHLGDLLTVVALVIAILPIKRSKSTGNRAQRR